MSRSTLYPDAKAILEQALASSGGSFVCATHEEANRLRLRCYRFRKAYAKETGDYRFDVIRIPRIPPESSTIVFNVAAPAGFFIANEVPSYASSDLDRLAASLLSKLESDDGSVI